MVWLHKPSKQPLWRNPGNKLFWKCYGRLILVLQPERERSLSRGQDFTAFSGGPPQQQTAARLMYFFSPSIWGTRAVSESSQLNTEKTAPGGMIKVKLSPSVFGKDLVVRMPRYWIDTYIFENGRLISQTASKTDGYVLSCKSIARRPQVYHSEPRKRD